MRRGDVCARLFLGCRGGGGPGASSQARPWLESARFQNIIPHEREACFNLNRFLILAPPLHRGRIRQRRGAPRGVHSRGLHGRQRRTQGAGEERRCKLTSSRPRDESARVFQLLRKYIPFKPFVWFQMSTCTPTARSGGRARPLELKDVKTGKLGHKEVVQVRERARAKKNHIVNFLRKKNGHPSRSDRGKLPR